MNFKSFFTVWDGRADSRPAMDLAIQLTQMTGGHLDVLCLSANAPETIYTAEASPQVLEELAMAAKEEALALKADAQAMTAAVDVAATVRAAPLRLSEVPFVVGREGRFHDLIILPRPFSESGTNDVVKTALDGALFETLSPVLVCPPSPAGAIGRKILVAWNGDQEALRAIRAALPMLQKADQVEIAMVEPQQSNDRNAPGFALMTMLTRHGVNAILSPITRTAERVSDTLRQKARDMGADMIVMGAYGHSQFRERFLGGATREMLADAELPVLMTH
ncbi:MAG: universal stress protein [Pseudomonadota bacterium]